MVLYIPAKVLKTFVRVLTPCGSQKIDSAVRLRAVGPTNAEQTKKNPQLTDHHSPLDVSTIPHSFFPL